MQDTQARQERLATLRREISACDARAHAAHRPALDSDRDLQSLEQLFRSGFHECLGRSAGDHVVTLGFALSCAARVREATGKPVLYVTLGSERQEVGRVYAPGLAAHGLAPEDLLHVAVQSEKELYWVAEESLAARGLAAIVLDGGGRERRYDFTISRRLKLRVERASIPLFLVRPWQGEGATAATARWRVSRMPGLPEPLSVPRQALVGRPRFRLRLERGPAFHYRSWEFSYDASGRFRLVAPLADGPAGSWPQPAGARAA